MSTNSPPRDLTTGQAANLCGVTVRTILNWINKGILKSYILPGRRGDHRIRVNDLTLFMREHNIPVPQELAGSTGSILVVDDDSRMCKAINRTLAPLNRPIYSAQSVFLAGRLFEKIRPSLVTLDITMPKTSGIELLKALRASSPHTPTIIVSGASELALNQAKEAGANHIIPKPYNNQQLLDTAYRLLNHDT